MVQAQALNIQNLPTPKEERWKFTNLPKAMPANLVLADAPEEIIISRARGEISDTPHEITIDAQDGQHIQPQLKITLEDNAELTLVERHTGAGAYWKNMVSVITLGQNARLRHIRILGDDIVSVNTNMVKITCARDAVYDGFALNMGAKLSRNDIHAVMHDQNAEVSFNGVNLLGGDQHGDTTILIEHAAAHCNSNQFYRSLVNDNAHGVFQGKVHVHEGAQKTDGYQLSNALLLSDKAQMSTKPELEIYADDVVCSHGATTGQLEDEPLFYLRSRGLSEAQARLLLVEAFVSEVVDKISNDNIRTDVQKDVQLWLQKALG